MEELRHFFGFHFISFFFHVHFFFFLFSVPDSPLDSRNFIYSPLLGDPIENRDLISAPGVFELRPSN